MPQIQCVGADGVERTLEYVVEEDTLDHVWRCRVVAVPPVAGAPAFEMTFRPLGENSVRQIGIFNHQVPAHSAKGIPDAVLPAVANAIHKRIVSSPLQSAGMGVYRTVDAEKMWARLHAKGIAQFDDATNLYFIECHD